jgi:hypothetical protein
MQNKTPLKRYKIKEQRTPKRDQDCTVDLSVGGGGRGFLHNGTVSPYTDQLHS